MKKKKDEDEKDDEKKIELKDDEFSSLIKSYIRFKRLGAEALAKGDDKSAFRCFQGACSSGMGIIKFTVDYHGNGHRNLLVKLKEKQIAELKEFVENTRLELDKLDFDDKESGVEDDFWDRVDHLVKDCGQSLPESVKAVQTVYYSNWIDDIGDIISNIDKVLVMLKLYKLDGLKSMPEQIQEYMANKMRDRLGST